ncbi:MAG: ABC transporter ATP-binding protein, partial [Actinomycetota bacterium]
KVYRDGTRALDDFSLDVDDGEFMVFVGPSGCGKTTALRMVAGLEDITEGEIRIGETVVNDLHPRKRDIAMVFQNYALYPHMTVYKNLAFGLQERKMPKDEIATRVKNVSSMLGIDDLLKRRPAQLSGGQRQRVAMGRALVREPKAFLMDEPLSNLDAKLRVQVRGDLKRLHQRLGITTIYVTHDQVEAMTLGDRVAVLSNGILQQLGAPQDIYDFPANIFVAGFIGSPPMNLLRATARGGVATAGDLSLPIPGLDDGEIVLGLRPEHLRSAQGPEPQMEFEVEVVEPLGDGVIVHGSVTGQVVSAPSGLDEELLAPLPGARAEITAKFDPSVRPSPGERMHLTVAGEHAHVFDVRTGDAIRHEAVAR